MAPHVNPTWKLEPAPPVLFTYGPIRSRAGADFSCSAAPPAPGPPRQSVVDTWVPRTSVGPPPRGPREGSRAFAAKQNKGFTSQRRGAELHARPRSPSRPPPPPPAPSPSASVLPPLPLASASPARAAHLGRRRGVAERRLAPAAAFEEGRKQASKQGGSITCGKGGVG